MCGLLLAKKKPFRRHPSSPGGALRFFRLLSEKKFAEFNTCSFFGSSSQGRSSFCSAFVRRMGRNRKWVLEDNLQEAVAHWGPRPPSASWPQKGKRSSSAAAPSKVHSPPSSDATKTKNSSIPGARRRSCNLFQSQRRTAEFQAVTESSCGAREEPRRSRGGSTSQSVSPPSGSGFVGSRQPRRRTSQSISGAAKRQCRVQAVGERSDSCLKFVERAQGRVERQKKSSRRHSRFWPITSHSWPQACKIWNNCVQQHARRVPPPSHSEPASETTELRELLLEVEQLKRERNQWMGKPNNSQVMVEVVGDSRSSRMASLIDKADAKRRCVEPVS